MENVADEKPKRDLLSLWCRVLCVRNVHWKNSIIICIY